MKKLTSIFVLAVMLIGLAACKDIGGEKPVSSSAQGGEVNSKGDETSTAKEDESPISKDEVLESIKRYFDFRMFYNSLPADFLLQMKLMTIDQENEARKNRRDDDWYSTGVLYSDYKNAMLKYVSESCFESQFMSGYKNENGIIICLDTGSSGERTLIHDAVFTGEKEGKYQYKVKISEEKDRGVRFLSYIQVNFVKQKDIYVVDDYFNLEEKIEGDSVTFNCYFFSFSDEDHIVSGILENTTVEIFFREAIYQDTLNQYKVEWYKDGKLIKEGLVESGMTVKIEFDNGEQSKKGEYKVEEILEGKYVVKDYFPK